MKPEANGYRCLIGPYTDPVKAAVDLREVKTVSGYKEAFIRVVEQSSVKSAKHTAVATKPVVATTPMSSVSAERPITDAFKSPTASSQPNPVSAKPVAAKSAVTDKPKKIAKSNEGIVVRLTTALQGKTYVVPYLIENQNQFYMEHGKPWNRLSYNSASQICQQLDMSLATPDEFKALRSSGTMEKNQWPIQLPYWGADKNGLFTDREPNQLTGTSLLNVMCVK